MRDLSPLLLGCADIIVCNRLKILCCDLNCRMNLCCNLNFRMNFRHSRNSCCRRMNFRFCCSRMNFCYNRKKNCFFRTKMNCFRMKNFCCSPTGRGLLCSGSRMKKACGSLLLLQNGSSLHFLMRRRSMLMKVWSLKPVLKRFRLSF